MLYVMKDPVLLHTITHLSSQRNGFVTFKKLNKKYILLFYILPYLVFLMLFIQCY